MFKFLEKQKYPVILLAVGALLILSGFFELKDLTKFEISSSANPNYYVALIGIVFSIISIVLYIFDEATFGWIGIKKIKKIDNGITTKISNTHINIRFGRLEQLAEASKGSMVVLPANEFFDDECINDKSSALGAYVNQKFTNQTELIKGIIAVGLSGRAHNEVEKEAEVCQKSFGVGVGVFVSNPLSSNQPILFVSVTTKRAGEGLRAEMSYIFEAVKEIGRVAVDHRIDSIYVPVLGSGHGGLRKEVALFGILLAVCDTVTKPGGHHIKDFNIVVFQNNERDKPTISKAVSKRLLRIATGMYSK